MSVKDFGELQSVLIGAQRCLDCRDPRCVNLCPNHVDIRAAMRLIVGRAATDRPPVWMQPAEEAAASVRDAIEASFELF